MQPTGSRAANSEYVSEVKMHAMPLTRNESEMAGPAICAPTPTSEYTPAPTEHPTPYAIRSTSVRHFFRAAADGGVLPNWKCSSGLTRWSARTKSFIVARVTERMGE
jgi:hypothetical protein